MSDHPSTIQGETVDKAGIDWDDYATLHMKGDGQGVFVGFKSVRSGTLAELVHFVASLPESERQNYVIQKAGDHMLKPGEIEALVRRPDFPR